MTLRPSRKVPQFTGSWVWGGRVRLEWDGKSGGVSGQGCYLLGRGRDGMEKGKCIHLPHTLHIQSEVQQRDFMVNNLLIC